MKKEVKMTPKLREFLRKKKLLTRFKNNANHILVDEAFVFSEISESFRQDNSPEGSDFWVNIDREFIRLKPFEL